MRAARLVSVITLALAASALFPGQASASSTSPQSIDFGSVVVGKSRTSTLVVRATGVVEGNIFGSSSTPSITVGQGNCSFVDEECDLAITFAPTALGPVSGTVTVSGCLLLPCTTIVQLALVPVSGIGASSVASRHAPSWPGWDIARGVTLTSFADSGYVLDGFGGIHGFSNPSTPVPAGATTGPRFSRDLARGIALLPDNTGGYVVDAFGGLHGFGIGLSAPPPPAVGPRFSGDLARGVAVTENGTGGYVLDAFGGLHRFAIGSNPQPPVPSGGPHWPGFKIARGIATGKTGGYVLDGYGGVHRFATLGTLPPAVSGGPSWRGWDIARGIAMGAVQKHGVVIDGYGGLHNLTST
jgi:hypothetical protein